MLPPKKSKQHINSKTKRNVLKGCRFQQRVLGQKSTETQNNNITHDLGRIFFSFEHLWVPLVGLIYH